MTSLFFNNLMASSFAKATIVALCFHTLDGFVFRQPPTVLCFHALDGFVLVQTSCPASGLRPQRFRAQRGGLVQRLEH